MRRKSISFIVIISTFLLACNHSKVNNRIEKDASTYSIFPKGNRIANDNFTGTAWVQMMVTNDSIYNTSVGNVTFEPGARTNWHYHPGGQILLVTSGKGRYGEDGKPVKNLLKGDIIKCAPNIKHWHGAAPDSEMSHIAIGTNLHKGTVVWLQPVSNEEYSW